MEPFLLIVLVLFIMIVVMTVLVILTSSNKNDRNKVEMFDENNSFPKTIWTYWKSKDLPPIIVKCIESWSKYNPSYKIHVVSDQNIQSFLPGFDVNALKHNDAPARESDFVRIHLLSKFGGFWLDSSIICTKSLDWIQKRSHGKEFFGFYIPNFTTDERYPVIENWCFACIPNSTFVTNWRDEFMRINSFKLVDDYVRDVEVTHKIDLQNLPMKNYLAMHVAVQKVLQTGQQKETLSLMNTNDPDFGPYTYLNSNGWDTKIAIQELLKGNYVTPLIKMRGDDRKVAETLPTNEFQGLFDL